MKIEVTKQFNTSAMKITIEDSDMKKCLQKALVYTQPDVCGLCKSTEIRWDTNKAQTDDGEFIYVKRICRKCGATSTMGDYKGGGNFWKQWEERYVKGTKPIEVTEAKKPDLDWLDC